MAFQADVRLIVPSILVAMANAARPLTDKERGKLKTEVEKDPGQLGLRDEEGNLKSPYEVAALLNKSGRISDVVGDVVIEAADIMEAVQGAAESAPQPSPASVPVKGAAPAAGPAAGNTSTGDGNSGGNG